ncbi:DUF3822 family protein [Segatella baroniae]|uniref:DUF3822 family protein n=1 Tax=Segatella baroniae TaxID=305719 RepID=UPI000404768D|nr:DUF3822 family protein [Segatella baroniae]
MQNKAYNILNNRLTIRISQSFMSFAVANQASAVGIEYEPYTVKNGISTAANLREAFNESALLGMGFTKVQVMIDAPVLLVPVEEFDESQKETLYSHAFTRMGNDLVIHAILPNENAVALFPLNKDLNVVINDHFNDIRILPLMQPVWSYMHHRSFSGSRNKLYAYFHDHKVEVFGFRQNRFKFCNHYKIVTPFDASYFILYVWKLLGMDARNDELHVFGSINERETLLADLKKCLQSVYVINPEAEFNRAPITKIKGLPMDVSILFLKGR